MTSVFEPVRQARRLWERSQPQLFLEVDELSDPAGADAALPAAPPLSGANPAGSLNPSTPSNTNAGSAQDLSGTRALPAEGA